MSPARWYRMSSAPAVRSGFITITHGHWQRPLRGAISRRADEFGAMRAPIVTAGASVRQRRIGVWRSCYDRRCGHARHLHVEPAQAAAVSRCRNSTSAEDDRASMAPALA
jgi:hypothetical protein